MKVALAQTKPVSGDIEANILDHLRYINCAIDEKADIIFFPELSITGYEPIMASLLALTTQDPRLRVFHDKSLQSNMTICIGGPLRVDNKVQISQIIFGFKNIMTNSKTYLHPDEEPFFIPGTSSSPLVLNNRRIGLAICYEISVSAHREMVFKDNVDLYVASVAKSESGIAKALGTMSETSQKYNVPCLMCNGVGLQDGSVCAGSSSVWDHKGRVLEQLHPDHTGVLFYNTANHSTKILYL